MEFYLILAWFAFHIFLINKPFNVMRDKFTKLTTCNSKLFYIVANLAILIFLPVIIFLEILLCDKE
jgi:hypothetical protein